MLLTIFLPGKNGMTGKGKWDDIFSWKCIDELDLQSYSCMQKSTI